MVFCVVHLDAPSEPPEDEEIYVVVPGAAQTAIALPLDALPRFLPLLEQAVADLPPPQCTSCRATMPSLAVCPSPHSAPGQTG